MTTAKRTYKYKTTPTVEQTYALKSALKQGKYGIFFQQRVGKTKVAIDFCGVNYFKKNARKVLIVCPLSVRSEWEAQVDDHLPDEIPRLVFMYPDKDMKINELLKCTKKPIAPLVFLVVNYDKLTTQRERILWWDADIVIFDESHLVKHHNSKRSKASASITKNKDMVLLLTGTPITKSWTDIFSQFKVMNPEIFGSRWVAFREKYAIMGGYMNKQVVGCTDIDDIKAIVKDHSVRVLRKSVMKEPEIEEIILKIPFEPSAQKRYDELKKTWVTELNSGAVVEGDLAVTRLMRLQQFCGGFATSSEGVVEQISSAKAEVLRDLLTTKQCGNEKMVIFHRFKAEAVLLQHVLRKFNVGYYNGSVPEDERLKVRKDFQAGKLDAIVVQIATGAMGVSFDTAHINVFYSLDFSLMNYLQAKDRVMGRNQTSEVVTNYYLAIDKSIDLKLINTLKNNEDFASSVSDAYKAVLKGSI